MNPKSKVIALKGSLVSICWFNFEKYGQE
jgi:hypothetical protein